MTDRIRFIALNGRITVRDLAFSQVTELTRGFTSEQYSQYLDGTDMTVVETTVFAEAGSKIKLVG